MKTEHLRMIIQAKKNLEKVIELVADKDTLWREYDLILFTDLRQACNLFDFEMEQAASKLEGYNKKKYL